MGAEAEETRWPLGTPATNNNLSQGSPQTLNHFMRVVLHMTKRDAVQATNLSVPVLYSFLALPTIIKVIN